MGHVAGRDTGGAWDGAGRIAAGRAAVERVNGRRGPSGIVQWYADEPRLARGREDGRASEDPGRGSGDTA